MLGLYRILYLPLFILFAPFAVYRMLRRGGYGRDLHHRLGLYPHLPKKSKNRTRLWIQAVSVGELLAIGPLLKALHDTDRFEIVVTTTTSTGYVILSNSYQELTLFRGYFPLDFWPITSRAWRRIDPDIIVLTESELWPEHLQQAKQRQIPALLINARISDRSFKRYQRAAFFAAWNFSKLTHISASSEIDAKRIADLGVDSTKIQITGNLKLDTDIQPRLTAAEIAAERRACGFDPEDLVVLGSSTWPGEEAMLARYVMHRRNAGEKSLKLLIVPRHAERRNEICQDLQALGITARFRHLQQNTEEEYDSWIYVADTTGELKTLTQIADIAFIGKSMPQHQGGQTPVEAAIAGLPIVMGPDMTNFRAITQSIIHARIARVGSDEAGIFSELDFFLSQADERASVRERAASWHRSNRGALQRTVELIHSYVHDS